MSEAANPGFMAGIMRWEVVDRADGGLGTRIRMLMRVSAATGGARAAAKPRRAKARSETAAG